MYLEGVNKLIPMLMFLECEETRDSSTLPSENKYNSPLERLSPRQEHWRSHQNRAPHSLILIQNQNTGQRIIFTHL